MTVEPPRSAIATASKPRRSAPNAAADQIEKPDEPYWTPWTGFQKTATTFRYGGPDYPLKDPKDPKSGRIVEC